MKRGSAARASKTKGKLFLSWDEFDAAVERLAIMLRPYAARCEGIYGEPRGGLPLAVALSHRLELPLLELPEKGDRFIWIDDIVDTGKTFERLARDYPDAIAAAWLVRECYPGARPIIHQEVAAGLWVVFPWEDAAAADREAVAYAVSRQ